MSTTNGNSCITRRTPISDLPEMLTADETAAWLGIARNTIFELVRRNEIKSIRLGRLIRIPKTALAELASGSRA